MIHKIINTKQGCENFNKSDAIVKFINDEVPFSNDLRSILYRPITLSHK